MDGYNKVQAIEMKPRTQILKPPSSSSFVFILRASSLLYCSSPFSSSNSIITMDSTIFTSSSSSSSSLLSLKPSSIHSLQGTQFPTKFKLPNRPVVVRSACSSGGNGHVNTPNRIFMEEVIGAEYGEGFETFRSDGPLKVDVDFLNNRLQEGFLKRIRYAMKPDEAYGLIFSWDNVVANTQKMKLNAWKQLAFEEGKDIPVDREARKLLSAGVDHVLRKVLLWGGTESEVDRLKSRLSDLYYDNLVNLSAPIDGLQEWLDAVSTAQIPCAVVSNIDHRYMVETLERMGLKKYFQAVVSEKDGMESIAHRFLSAAMKLDRKPSKCVVFEDDPRGVAAAHNCTMMAVALIGAHPAYDLGQADLAVANFNELSVINLRRLFANKGSTFMELQKQIVEKTPPRRKLTIDTIF